MKNEKGRRENVGPFFCAVKNVGSMTSNIALRLLRAALLGFHEPKPSAPFRKLLYCVRRFLRFRAMPWQVGHFPDVSNDSPQRSQRVIGWMASSISGSK